MEEVRKIYPVGASAMYRKVKTTPTKEAIAEVVPGNSVRICVCGEDFWVEVTEINENLITGTVDNDLLMVAEHTLYKGDLIQFHNSAVFQIFVPEV